MKMNNPSLFGNPCRAVWTTSPIQEKKKHNMSLMCPASYKAELFNDAKEENDSFDALRYENTFLDEDYVGDNRAEI